MNYNLFNCMGTKEIKPKNLSEDFGAKVKEALDVRQAASKNGAYKLVVPSTKEPQGGRMYFLTYHFNSKKMFTKLEQGAYEYSKEEGTTGRIRHTKNRQTMGVAINKKHIFGDK